MSTSKELHGVWDRMANSWQQVKGEVRKQWGKLTDDDLMEIRGQRDILLSKIQARYNLTVDEANRQIDKWTAGLKK